MGLFDKLKKAFIKEKEEEQQLVEEQQEEKIDESADEEATEGSEGFVQADEPSQSEDLTEEVAEVMDVLEAEPVEEHVEVEPEPAVEAVSEPIEEESVQEKYDKGLAKTRKTFKERMNELFANFRSVDEDFFEEVEETLIGADVGFETSMRIAEELRQEVKLKNIKKPGAVQNAIIEKLVDLYEAEGMNEVNDLNLQPNGLTVMLFVGVNGVGKTTSIGKLAHEYKQAGKKVLLAAADTFRAGAIDQLVVWGDRAGVEVVRGAAGGDPAAVVFDAMVKAKEQQADVLLVDTAGRLQNKVNLMKELDKIKRIIQREEPNAPHEVLLVLDATTGQNAMIQAKQFKETTDVTGLVLTKLDGTAKGGIVLAIRNELHLPVKLVGLGEGIDDLEVFNPNDFVMGLFKGLIEEE
ncbi:MAG TPA: signal recognition particle-docking protein FtsY [Enterococcus sp.]|nr:signal recognition particle-docking protein FtsY [Enterococcus sp.]